MERHITLLLRNGTRQDVNKIKEWCKAQDIEFAYRYSRTRNMVETNDEEMITMSEFRDEEKISPLYYFTIFSDTAHYLELQKLMGEKLTTTDFADFSNIADCDDKFEKEWKDIVDSIYKNNCEKSAINTRFLQFIMPIEDVRVLEAMEIYTGFMDEHQREMLYDRIEIVKGNKDDVHEEFVYNMLSIHNDVKFLRERTGMNRREFCKYFDIPYRTMEDWENKKSTCATYLYKLMEEKLIKDGLIKDI